MFLGITLESTSQSLQYDLNPQTTDTYIEVKDTTIDDMYISKNSLYDFDWVLPNNWDFQIILHAMFNDGSMNAGNKNYRDATEIRLKKRYVGTFDWKTIYSRDVSREAQTAQASRLEEILNISYDDYLEPNKRDVEYAYTAIINGVETEPVVTSATSFFFGYYLVGQCDENGVQSVIPALFNIENNVTLHRASNTVVSPGQKYPFIVNNGSSKYYGGTFSVTFMPHDDDVLPIPQKASSYRNSVDEFLTDGYPKILKTYDGDIYMAAIVGDISRSNHTHYQNVGTSFEWAEVGDTNDCGDLFDYGFINTDIDRGV